jgi:hypothetical protein
MKFKKHGQLCLVLSGVKSPGGLCILLPDDMDAFSLRPPIDLDVVQILETMQPFRPHQSSKFRLVIKSSLVLLPSIRLTQLSQTNSLAPDDYFDPPDDQIRCVPSLDHDAVETVDSYPALYHCRLYVSQTSSMTKIVSNWAFRY